MFGEWRVCLVLLLVLWCGSRDVVGGGDGEELRKKYLELINEGENGKNGSPCREAPEGFYKRLSELAGKSADHLVQELGGKESEKSEGLSEVKYELTQLISSYSKSKRCIATEGLICYEGKCIECDKNDSNPLCGFIEMIVDKEGSPASSKTSEGKSEGMSEGGRVKTPVGVVVVSLVIGFVFAL